LWAVLGAAGTTACAQESSQQSASSSGAALVRLEHTRHPLATEANATGRVEGGRVFHRMLLLLSPSLSQEASLEQLLDDQQNPKSSSYHHWLSAAQFGAQFGASDTDVQTAISWLQASGFTVERVAGSKRWVEFSGTSAQVENAFYTVMNYYRVRGKTYVANATDLSIPAAMVGVTRGVVSLNNFRKRPPMHEFHGTAGRTAEGTKTKFSPYLTAVGTTNTYYLAPGDFAAIYNTKALLSSGNDGSGISIAVTGQSDIELTDVQQFRQIFGLKQNDPNVLLSGPDPGFVDQVDSEEAQLDVEWAGAVAPGATINVVIAGSTDTTGGVDLAAAYAIDNEVSPILTYTYGSCENALGSAGNAFYNALWQQAAAEGITVLVASGDNGAAGCDSPSAGVVAQNGLAVNGIAATPYNVAVGGTQFAEGSQTSSYWSATNTADYSSALGYIPESAWNESCDAAQPASSTNCLLGNGNTTLLATGGGASTVYSKPSWQAGTGVPADKARDVPDVALAAATGHDEAVYCSSLAGTPCQVDGQQNVVGLTLVGGTSLAAPSMAGVLALVEQKNAAFQGQINYHLYHLAQVQGNNCNASNQTNPTAQNSCVFYDVTAGNDEVPCAGASPGCSSTQSGTDGFTTGQVAGTGYDLATGLGSVNAANLAAAWKDATLAASQITLAASSNSFAHGTAVTLNGNVTAASGTATPTGAVAIKTDSFGDSKQTLALTKGAYSGSVSDLPGGSYNVRAYYAGDANFASGESTAIPVDITPEGSTTTLTVNGLQNGSAAYGAALQLKVNAAGASGQGVATGTVTVLDGTNTVATSTLAADGSAYLLTGAGATYAFAPGSHSLTASYSGDNSFNASTSATVALTISKGTPFVVVGTNTITLPVGQTLGVHAVVSGEGTAPATGTIQFTVDGVAAGTAVALQTGGFFGTQAQAAALIPNLAQGTHVIGANYNATGNGSADPNYVSVASGDPINELTQTVTVGAAAGTKTTTNLILNSAPMAMGGTGSFSVTVSPSTATGTVTLWDAAGPRTVATPMTSGTATVQFVWPQAGSTSVYAVYSGDSSNAGSTSASVSFTVQPGAPQVKLTAPASLTGNGEVSLNASVTGNPANPQVPYPTGAVEFWDSLNGAAAQLLLAQPLTSGPGGVSVYAARVKLAPGSHSLYAHYRGDTNWQSANSAAVPTQVGTFSVSISEGTIGIIAGSPANATVTITPSGGFSGTVSLTCPSGGTFLPAGYSCSLASTVQVNGSPATTPLTLTPFSSSSSSAAIKHARTFPPLGFVSAPSLPNGASFYASRLSFLALGPALLLLAFGVSGARNKNCRNFLASCGLILCVGSVVFGCGGGGGSGPFSTTTTMVSSNLKVAFGQAVTFTVTVKPNGGATPSGPVQLYDNGQAYGGAVNVSAGIATFLTTNLPVGVHNFTADYRGDSGTLASSSATIVQVVTGTTALQISGAANGISETADVIVVVN
jgi:hypothetical protein